MAGRRKKSSAWDSIRRADEKWLAEGGVHREHTKIGVATAGRLVPYHPKLAKALREYIASAPAKMPVSDYEAEYGALPTAPKIRSKGTLWVTEVPGGLPGLGKRQ